MKLYYSPGACSQFPHIVMRELGLDPALVRVDLRKKQTETGADFLAINSKGYVPALELDDGAVLTEGVAVATYLADAHTGHTLAPTAGTVERAHQDGLLIYIATEVHKSYAPMFHPACTPEIKAFAVTVLSNKLGYLEGLLSDGRAYLTGDDATLADIYLFVALGWARFVEFDLSPWPNLVALQARVGARPAVQAALKAEGLI